MKSNILQNGSGFAVNTAPPPIINGIESFLCDDSIGSLYFFSISKIAIKSNSKDIEKLIKSMLFGE